jgi:hypothetical protein
LCLLVVCLFDVCFVIGRRAVGIMAGLPMLHFSWSARSIAIAFLELKAYVPVLVSPTDNF